MNLTAREWLILPEAEQISRAHELSPHECFLLRTVYAYIHFTEEQKMTMTEQEKHDFVNPPQKSPEELEYLKMQHKSVFEEMMKRVEK